MPAYASTSVSATPALSRPAPFTFDRLLDPSGAVPSSSSLVVPRGLLAGGQAPSLPPFMSPLTPRRARPNHGTQSRAATSTPAPSFQTLVNELLAHSASQTAPADPHVRGTITQSVQNGPRTVRGRPGPPERVSPIRKFGDVDMEDLDPLARRPEPQVRVVPRLREQRVVPPQRLPSRAKSGATQPIVQKTPQPSTTPPLPTPFSCPPSPTPSPLPLSPPSSSQLFTLSDNNDAAGLSATKEIPQAPRTDPTVATSNVGDGATMAERLMAYLNTVESDGSSDSESEGDDEGVTEASVAPSSIKAPVPRPAPPDGAGDFGFSPFDGSLLSQFSPRHRAPRPLEYSLSGSPPAQLRSVHRTITSKPFPRQSSASPSAPSSMTSAVGYHYVSATHASLGHRQTKAQDTTTEETKIDDPDGWYGCGLKLWGEGSAYTRYRSKPSPRDTVPPMAMTSFQRQIIQSWQNAEPSPKRKADIRELLKHITTTLRKYTPSSDLRDGDRYRVDVFGSVAWGGETGESGDVDLVIIDTELPLGYDPDFWRVPPGENTSAGGRVSAPNLKVPKIYHMRALATILRDAGMKDVKPIISANTPIVKFRRGDLQCDICTNDLGGWYNSALILAYCELSPYVLRPMVHTLKKWLSAHGLNDPSGRSGPRTMSSYCLTLMAIAYLQHQGVLPNLQAQVSVPIPSDPSNKNQMSTVWLSWGRRQGEVAHIWFARRAPAGWKSARPDMTAEEAVRGFFEYFSVTFNPKTQFVSVANGGINSRRQAVAAVARARDKYEASFSDLAFATRTRIMREYDEEVERMDERVGKCTDRQPSEWNRQYLVVQDPFLWHKNCAQTMGGRGAREDNGSPQEVRFFKTIKATHQLFRTRHSVSLLDILDAQTIQNVARRA